MRDIRLRWACEEAGLDYSVHTVPFDERGPDHLAHQPFAQIPFLSDGEVELFESGAGLLHLARKSETLMPRDPAGEAQTLQWTIAALNSIEMVSVPWWFLEVTGAQENNLAGWLESRLDHMERIFTEREWLVADRFTVADLLMADVLRVANCVPSKSAGGGSLCGEDHRQARIQEGACRSVGSFRRRRRKASGKA